MITTINREAFSSQAYVSCIKANETNSILKWLVIVWIVTGLYWPVMRIGGVEFRSDYPLLGFMLCWLILRPKLGRVTWIALRIFLMYLVLILIAMLNGYFLGYSVNFIKFFGFLTLFLTIAVWSEILRRISIVFVYRLIALIAIPSALLSIFQISFPSIVQNLTLSWYSSSARPPSTILFGINGNFSRACSVFESPTYAGMAFIVFSICAWVSAQKSKRSKNRYFYFGIVILYMIAGMTTASSTFLLAVVLFLSFLGARVFSNMNLKKWLGLLLGVCLLSGGIIAYVQKVASSALLSQVRFQFYKLTSGLVFSRYRSEGSVASNWEHWDEYFFLGVGGVNSPFVVGDNLYNKLLVDVGILGVSFFVFLMGLILYHTRQKNDIAYGSFLIIIIGMAAGLGSATFMVIRLSEVMAFVVAAGLFVVIDSKIDRTITSAKKYNTILVGRKSRVL